VIVSFAGGGEFQRRLLDMGLSIGFPVKVVQGGNGQKGPMIVQAGDTRLMLGHGMAEKIRIK
jgi:ferrous iron transport protein A